MEHLKVWQQSARFLKIHNYPASYIFTFSKTVGDFFLANEPVDEEWRPHVKRSVEPPQTRENQEKKTNCLNITDRLNTIYLLYPHIYPIMSTTMNVPKTFLTSSKLAIIIRPWYD